MLQEEVKLIHACNPPSKLRTPLASFKQPSLELAFRNLFFTYSNVLMMMLLVHWHGRDS